MRVLVAVLVALGATGAAALPFALDGPVFALNLSAPESFFSPSPSGPAGHAGHPVAPDAHAHAAPASRAGHAAHAGTPAAGPEAHEGQGHEAAAQDGHAAHGLDGPGMQRPAFPPAEGRVPSSPEGLTEVSGWDVRSDADLADLGLPGAGTLDDPYVFSGYHVRGTLGLRDTDACVVVAGNYIDGQLALNWNGQCVWVHHNWVRDLRVNENDARTGYATGGLVEHNEFGILGQLRHFDGEFRHNVVGPLAPDLLFDPVKETVLYPFLVDARVANIDGFNQGLIHHNEFLGTVDLDFHGHHHGTGFFAPHSHYHGSSARRQAADLHDHTDRWTSVAFTDNLVVDPEGYGVRYEDRAHSGDDRTARSEDLEVLDEPHTHHTDIVLARNTIRGGGQLWVDVFNAEDDLHRGANPGTLTIEGNVIELEERMNKGRGTVCGVVMFGEDYDAWSAIHVQLAQDVTARIVGNRLTYLPLSGQGDPVATAKDLVARALHECLLWPDDRTPAAIRLEDIDDGDVLVQGNTASGFAIGVDGLRLSDTAWRVVGNDFGQARAVRYDAETERAPETT